MSKKLKGHDSDTIIRLDVGSALELADLLFPLASRKIESVLSVLPPSGRKLSSSEAFLGPGNTVLVSLSLPGLVWKIESVATMHR